MDRTFIIIKPDAVKNRYAGKIIARIEAEGFKIAGLRLIKMTTDQAKGFYEVHKERPFYQSLCDFMTSGPVIIATLQAEGAVQKWRDLIGATDPAEALDNTIRKLYAESKEKNAVHGSDSDENAKIESEFFFKPEDLVG